MKIYFCNGKHYEVLDTEIIHEDDIFRTYYVWLRGKHPELCGKIIKGLTGIETRLESQVLKKLRIFCPENP